jgi:homogentisate 1,2-dioxygenase
MATVFGGAEAVTAFLQDEGAKRPLVVTSSQRSLSWLDPALIGREPLHFERAAQHVPRDVVEKARAVTAEADAIVTLGGGAATGLGKALRLELDLPFVAIPTTYAASEQTNIWGITDEGSKETGRDDRVRPDLVVYDEALSTALPVALSVQSLLNAMAHSVSALSTGQVEDESAALRAIKLAYDAARGIVLDPTDPETRRLALEATAHAGRVLDRSPMGEHHARAHLLGGKHDLPHAPLHACLLVQTVAALDDGLQDRIGRAMRERDPAARLVELLRRAGAPLSLRALGLEHAQVEGEDAVVRRAFFGRGPSRDQRQVEHGGLEIVLEGPPPAEAERVVVVLPGRNGTAEGTLELIRAALGSDPRVLLAAPMPPKGSWYDAPYSEVGSSTLSPIFAQLDALLDGLGDAPAHLFGFSQGACLALAYAAQTGRALASLTAIAGATPPSAAGELAALAGVPVLYGISEADPWIDRAHVDATKAALEASGASARFLDEPGDDHGFFPPQRRAFRELVMGALLPAPPTGFGNVLSSEALPGALPLRQNSPRHPPYGLQPEQINNTGFVAPRALNRRSWVYRARPSAQQRALKAVTHPTLGGDLSRAPDPNLAGYRPLPLPEAPTDFVDGLVTFGGAGSAAARRGFAVHLYAANRSMRGRAFHSTDGELLLMPQEGALHIQTEMGWLDIEPGWIAVVPRGVRFSVHVDGPARGWVAEVYGRSFSLPERGPIGANGLTEPRHFEAPRAAFEDLVSPGYEILTRHMGRLYSTTQDFTPFDVAAWHGDDLPFRYELKNFCPAGFTAFDHTDPSAFIVLTTPQDEPGSHTLDLVFFPPRTEVARHTFRPPFHHRNAVNEINLVIDQPGGGMFASGTTFITPSHTPHMVRAHAVERALDQSDLDADLPKRFADDNVWLQLETSLPITRTPHADALAVPNWRARWGEVRRTFRTR